MHKSEFGIRKIHFLGYLITEHGMAPNKETIEHFLKTIRMPKALKQVRRLGFMQYFAKFFPNLSVKLQPFFKLLRKENVLITTQEHQISLEILKNSLKGVCNLSLKMAKAGCQLIIVSDASYYGAGYILPIEDYHDRSLKPNEKTYATVAFGSHLFSPAHLKHSIFANKFFKCLFCIRSF